MHTASTSPSYPLADYTHLSPLPPLDHGRLVMSTWHALEQPPPPSLREILGAYRSKGDGDRDMLIAMLNAKTAEDQRMASVTSLHRALLELYTTEVKTSAPPPSQHYPLSSPHINSAKHKRSLAELHNGHEPHTSAPSPREPAQQPQPPRKRKRSSRSPTQSSSSHYDAHSSHTSSRDLPPSPYSSRSDSEEYSPRSRASMAIGSLLSSGAGRESAPDDSRNAPDVRFPPSAIGVS